jgi:hypothetical protein
MNVEALKNYGRPYSETMTELPDAVIKLSKKEGFRITRKHLGLLGSLRLMFLTGREKKRLAAVDLSPLKQKGLNHEAFIRQLVGNTALFSAMDKIAGREKTLAIHHEIMDAVAGPMNEALNPPIDHLQETAEPFKAFRDYMTAFFEAEKTAGLHDYEVIEDSDTAVALNVTYCAFCEIPRLCGIVDACDPGCYSDEVFFPNYLEPLGIRFVRTKTLARGGDCCDFRFEKI